MSSLNALLDYKPFIDGVKDFEGRFPRRYRDEGGHWTIGYGHLITKGENFTDKVLSDEEMDELLLNDLAKAAVDAKNILKGIDTRLNQWRAMTDWVFNLGAGNLQSSTLRKLYNAQDFPAAARQINRWVYCTMPNGERKVLRGLQRRRQWETNIFLNGDYSIVRSV